MRRRPQMLCIPLILALPICACRQESETGRVEDVNLEFVLQPDPPKVGTAIAVITLLDKDGRPVLGAKAKLEGNMNHAGMKPVFADATELDPGRYEAKLDFTMGGDWFILINITLRDGRKMNRKVDVKGVRSN